MAAVFMSKNEIYGNQKYLWIRRTKEFEFPPVNHYHDFYEVTYYRCLDKPSPIGKIFIGGNEYALSDRVITVINAFEPHHLILDPEANYERFCLNFDLSFLLAMSSDTTNLLYIFSQNKNSPIFSIDSEIDALIMDMINRYANPPLNSGVDIFRKCTIGILLSNLYNLCVNEESIVYDPDFKHIAMISKIVQYVNDHIYDNLSLETLSSVVNYSTYYVSRIFHQQTGISLVNYISMKRIDYAKILLSNNEFSITQISKMIGYENYNHFFRTFRESTGMSPKKYRELQQKND